MSGLDTIALRTQTDKNSKSHNYTAIYDPLFTPFRWDTFNFLEVGIYHGASIRMWREWFPNATIYGIDNRQKRFNEFNRVEIRIGSNSERVVLDKVDQSNAEQLTEYAKKGPWRVIVDDGSHKSSHQKLTFDILWDQVEPGGYYIIEDTHTSYFPERWKTVFIDCDETLVQRMLRLADEVSGAPYSSKAFNNLFVRMENDDLTQHQNEVEYIQFRMGLIILKKRGELADYGKP